jgi:hypothetical protein
MPSTYTLNNGIELIATGEKSGTWGDTTNVNLGLIDTALDGQVTITLAAAGTSGSPNTLPINDGSASDGRNRLIIFTDGGDLGATAFVQLTPNYAEKIVYIRNNLTGGRAITLFQGTYNASNDYEVPAGTTAVVFFNGGGTGAVAANVFNNAFFDSLRLGGVSVTAILDEDNMASDSATALATQQSIKAYVDAQVGANNELSEILANGNTSSGNNIQMTTTDEVQFRDTALTIKSSVDGQLDIAADVELEIVAPTLDINASTAVTIDTTTMTMTGSVNVVGDLDVDNLNINGNSIISTNTDGNIALTPNGTGEVDITKVDIDGGTIDGVTIGGASAGAGTFTTLTASNILPSADNTYDLGGVGAEWKDLYIDGTANIDSLVADTADINGGTIDGTVIGGSTPAAISGTTGSFSGDVSIADKIVHTGDTNTAIRFPAADTVTVETAGSERMRITSTGIVGIGTTAEAGNSRLHVTDGVTAFNDGAGSPYFQLYNGNAGTDLKTWRIGGLTAGDFTVETVNDAYTLATSRMAITSAGNVGIGTSSPAQKLVTYAASGSLEILNTVRNDNTGAGVAAIGFNVAHVSEGDFTQAGIGLVRGVANGGGALAFYNKSDGATGNFTTANERMRVDSGGNFIIGGTSSSARFAVLSAQGGNFGNRQIYIEDTTAITSQPGIGFHASANSTAGIIKFYGPSSQFEIRNSTDTGFIAILASAFVVSSDYRLKENIVPLVGACDRLKQIPVHRFNFKPLEETGVEFHDMTVDGFLAHEVQPFVPEAITGEKDAVDGAGKPAYQGIDQSKLVPLLTAALQEALARIETLEAEVAALKGAS